MTSEQVRYILGKVANPIKDIHKITFTAQHCTIYTMRYNKLTFDDANSLLVTEDSDGEIAFWDYTDINGIFLTKDVSKHNHELFDKFEDIWTPDANLH